MVLQGGCWGRKAGNANGLSSDSPTAGGCRGGCCLNRKILGTTLTGYWEPVDCPTGWAEGFCAGEP